jgi:hypothetical protein
MFDAFNPAWFTPGLNPAAQSLSPQGGYDSQMAVQQAMAPAPPVWLAPPVPPIPQALIQPSDHSFLSFVTFNNPPPGTENQLPSNFTPSPPTITVDPNTGALNMPPPAPSPPISFIHN